MSDDPTKSMKHLAHDLNNIFTRILNSVELLKRKIPNSPDILSILNNIESGTYLASEMIENQLGSDLKKNTYKRRININSIINDAVRSFSHQQKEGISFQLHLDTQLRLVEGKYTDFFRVLMNLITNSIEAIDGKGTITITTKNSGEIEGLVQIIIRDNGEGIDEASIAKIFDEDFSTKNKASVSGVGLSIVKKIVEDYSGTIKVSSKQGIGTEFIVAFPSTSKFETKAGLKTKTILIAEDEEILLELFAELLQSHGYHVISSLNGKETLSLLNKHDVDLVIIDRKMPEMDGITCIQEMKKLNYKIPVIISSGSQTDEIEIAKMVEVEKIVNKPYNFEEMLSVIHELIG